MKYYKEVVLPGVASGEITSFELQKKYQLQPSFIHDGKRISPCECQFNRWVTLTPDGCISYCATHSKVLGNGLQNSSYEIFNNNIDYLNDLKKKYCSTCSHYISTLSKKGKKDFYLELLRSNKVVR